MTRRSGWSRRLILLAGLAIFMVFLTLPVADNVLHIAPPVSLMENEPTALPEFNYDFSRVFMIFNMLQRGYLDRVFGFRKLLVRWQNWLDIFALRSSTHYHSVVLGKDNWLFLGQENNDLNVVDDYRAERLYTPEELAAWTREYTSRRDWLAARGIRYLVVIAPNKLTIYPEFLPGRFNRVNPESRTDQLTRALGAAGLDVVDLRGVLKGTKGQAQVYYRTDSHWNPYGAFVAYAEVMERLGEWFPRLAGDIKGYFDIDIRPGLPGGLASMLALGDVFPEDMVVFVPRTPRRARILPESPMPPDEFQKPEIYEIKDPELPRAMVFRDSFAHELIPFLSEHFSRVVYRWPYPSTPRGARDFDKAAIEAEKPDVVIDEYVERYFTTILDPLAKEHDN